VWTKTRKDAEGWGVECCNRRGLGGEASGCEATSDHRSSIRFVLLILKF
jgi:hypothetical protein